MSKIYDRYYNKYKFHIEQFNSAAEVADVSSTRQMTSSSFYDIRTEARRDWHGATYDEAIDMLRHGYQPTVDSMKGVFKAGLQGESKRFSFQNSVAGFAPVVPLALKGVPNSMIDMRLKPIKAKVVDIYYDSTFRCGTSSEDIIKTGQKVLGAIVELERQGYRFNLYAVQSYCDSIDADVLIVKVKSAEQPLDLKRVSFPLTHTAFFRAIGFDWYSKMPGGRYRGGYGRALVHEFKKDGEAKKIMETVLGKNSVYIAGTSILQQDAEYIKEIMTNGNSKN